MIQLFLSKFLNCQHRVWGWPITIDNRTYRVCLQCGLERKYNWRTMQFTQPRRRNTIRKNSLDNAGRTEVKL